MSTETERLVIELAPSVRMAFRLIPPGSFVMGARGEHESEEPMHRVKITRSFWLGDTSVTQEQFAEWTRAEGVKHKNENANKPGHPAVSMDWFEATHFCLWLTGSGLLPPGCVACLPTEAEWEYACRGGTETDYHTGDGAEALTEAGWFGEEYEGSAHPVRLKQANAFGLFDMHGNVWEWRQDAWDGHAYCSRVDGVCDPGWAIRGADYREKRGIERSENNPLRVLRGGSWLFTARDCRSADRFRNTPDARYGFIGFRVCLVPGPSGQPESGAPKTEKGEPASGAGVRGTRTEAKGAGGAGAVLSSEKTDPAQRRIFFSENDPSNFMNTTTQTVEPRAIFSADGQTWLHNEGTGPVEKIVIGTPPKAGEEAKPVELSAEVKRDLDAHLPTVTHLHLWQVKGLKTLPALPTGLKCLDVRGCAELESLPELPAGLETLVIDGCPLLRTIPLPAGRFPKLRNASMKGCLALEEASVNALLNGAPNLRWFDASDCPLLETIENWPGTLNRIELNGCAALNALPGAWPVKLHRLELRAAGAVSELAPLPASADYVDLAHTESMRALPAFAGKPRTLFLFGSGILTPPASEHGTSESENVAARTWAFFEDVEAVGTGAVKRCKVLLLGNGSAGKTCLSLALHADKDPMDARKLGTTHAVQFWDWDFKAKVGARTEDVQLHLWDFGGQEIYHNTHRLFMSKGAVFVVVWNPSQDGQQPNKTEGGYQDEWRPLRYWLDYIHLACPHQPRIAIVCSHHTGKTDELEARLRRNVDPKIHGQVSCYYVDSETRGGELDALRKWLRDEVGEVVRTQGTAVPSYWEIAQEMVRGWLQDGGGANEMPREDFRDHLARAIQEHGAKYPNLDAAARNGSFELTEDRIRRTLEFLTHSGWVYWEAQLFEGRVIVGQKWALDGIYTVLDRRPKSLVFRKLTESDGRFTIDELHELVWSDQYSKAEERLLISFMEQCRLCFRLRSAENAWRDRDVYVSCEHLSSAKAARLQDEFDGRLGNLGVETRTLEAPRLHSGNWQNFLIECGRSYGASAVYAKDGVSMENMEGEAVLVLCHFAKGGLGARIEMQVGGKNAAERLKSAVEYVKSFLPGAAEPASSLEGAIGGRAEVMEVFVSYAWNPPKKGDSGIPPGYEEPVNAIEEFLKGKPARLIRDKNATAFGENLKRFMEYGAKRPHVIVVHSDKYWRSACCIFELWTVNDALRKERERDLLSVVIPVEHLDSGITEYARMERYLEYWNGRFNTPALIGWPPDVLRDHARSLLRSFSNDLSNLLDLNIRWSDGREKALAAIGERLGLAAPKAAREDL